MEEEEIEDRILSIELFFRSYQPTEGYFQLTPFERIFDVPKFIESHLTIIKAQGHRRFYLPYLERLEAFRVKVLENNNLRTNE